MPSNIVLDEDSSRIIEVLQNTPLDSSTFQEDGSSNTERNSNGSAKKYSLVQHSILSTQSKSLSYSSQNITPVINEKKQKKTICTFCKNYNCKI